MTTIAEFLNTSKGYSFQKEATVRTWNPITWLGNPNQNEVLSGLKEAITPEFIKDQFKKAIERNPQYKPIASYLLNDPELFNYLAEWAPDDIYNYYEKDDNGARSSSTNWRKLQQQFSDPNNPYEVPTELENKFIDRAKHYITDQWNSPNNQQYLYQKALEVMPADERSVLKNQVAINPELANQVGNIIANQSKALSGGDIMTLLNPDVRETLYKKVTPQIQDAVISNGLNYMDMIPDDEVHPRMSEQEYLERNLFGDDEAFRGALDQYYNPDDPYRSNQVVFGLFNEFKNPDSPLRLAAIDHYRHLSEDERKNSMFAKWFNTMENFANDMGQADLQKQLAKVNQDFSGNMGHYGQTFFGNETIDEEFGNQAANYWDRVSDALSKSSVGKQWLNNWKGYKPTEAQNTAWQNYANDIRDRRMEDTFYGWFANPSAQKALQYAAPFATYGVPLAMMGSAMGTNAIWPLALLGGLGAAGMRYGAENGLFGMSPESMGEWDNWVSSINSPLGMMGGLLPKGMQPAFQTLFDVKDTSENTQASTGVPTTSGNNLPPVPKANTTPAQTTKPVTPPVNNTAMTIPNQNINKRPYTRPNATGNYRPQEWDVDQWNPGNVQSLDIA